MKYISGCENCIFFESCTQLEKMLGDCDDFESIHELGDDEDWAEDENQWLEKMYALYMSKDLEREFEYELKSW